jgi:hypothetical protein
MRQRAGADDVGRCSLLGECRKGAGRPGGDRGVGRIGQRLLIAVLVGDAEQPGKIALAIARGRAGDAADVSIPGAVLAPRHDRDRLLRGGKGVVGHLRGDQQHPPDGVARIGRRERPVEKVDPRDGIRRDQIPVRRSPGVVVADQRRDQQIIIIDQRPCARSEPPGPGRQHRLIVAVVALAHEQARQIFDGIFGVLEIDGLIDLFGRDAIGLLRQLKSLLDRRGAERGVVATALGGDDDNRPVRCRGNRPRSPLQRCRWCNRLARDMPDRRPRRIDRDGRQCFFTALRVR